MQPGSHLSQHALLSPEATLKQSLLLPLHPSLPCTQAPVLSSLPGLPGLSISQEGKQAEHALLLLASVPQHLVLRPALPVMPRASVLECSWTLLYLQLTPADGCGVNSIPQRQMLQYKVFT